MSKNFAYRVRQDMLKGSLKQRLEKKYKVSEHPKRHILWRLAWEHGHADGFDCVECHYEELVELIR